jgi:hypothetical protein
VTTPPPPPPPQAPPPPPGPSRPGTQEWYRQPGFLTFLGVVVAGIAAIIVVAVVSSDDAGSDTTLAVSTTQPTTTSSAPTTTSSTSTTTSSTTTSSTTTSSTTSTTSSTTTTSTSTTTTTTTTTLAPPPTLPPGDPYPEYVELSDDSGRITVTVPDAWNDTLGSPWERDGEDIGLALSASPDRDAFYDTWGMPGVFLGSSDQVGSINGYLDTNDFGDSCTYEGRFDYEDPLYAGLFDRWVDCGDEGSIFEMLAVLPLELFGRNGPDVEGLDLIVVEVIMVTQADQEAAQRIYDTFVVQDA